MEWAVVPSGVSALVAVAALIFAMRSSMAARRSADAAQRSVQAAERQLELAEQAAQRMAVRPPWRMQHRSGDTYDLINEGAYPLFDVTVTSGSMKEPVKHLQLDAGGAMIFSARRGLSCREPISVTWRESHEAEMRSWQRPLPPPPRPLDPRPPDGLKF
ncbi:hypothetical protein [Kineococcus aurantiacus]|uniref:Protein-L-isoaspartate O-methyltransferase n=1 Tax=Kineococcus aurantiacus TaxID=37633 RepID=A0A7Y9AS09_9ACTN|nr:hypothetical protein [Kineococcus aurantiacus]NYD20945.1 protein-L-isoaspartate O-methyltransferase [Kineococcus aurantiacus]